MKATDLALGDWVSLDGTPIQVAGLHGRKVGVHKRRRSIYCSWHLESEFQPIPLTSGILEKNGYRSTQGIDFFWLDDKKHCCMKNYDGKRLFCYKQGINDVWLVVKYVHQLQHLLRIVGIMKELVL